MSSIHSGSCPAEDEISLESETDSSASLPEDDDSSLESESSRDMDGKADEEEHQQVRVIALEENRRVRFWRIVMLIMILVTGALVSTFAYVFLSREEDGNYRSGVSIDGAVEPSA